MVGVALDGGPDGVGGVGNVPRTGVSAVVVPSDRGTVAVDMGGADVVEGLGVAVEMESEAFADVSFVGAPANAEEAVLAGDAYAIVVEPGSVAGEGVVVVFAIETVGSGKEDVISVVAVGLEVDDAFVVEFASEEEVASVGRYNDECAGIVVEVIVVTATGIVDGVACTGGVVKRVGAAIGHEDSVVGKAIGDESFAVGVVAVGIGSQACDVVYILCAGGEVG